MKPCEQPCPKCGDADIFRSFWAKGSGRPATKWARVDGKYEACDGWERWATRDHIANKCRCCGYEWKSLPMKKAQTA